MAKGPLENFVHQIFQVAARVELEPLCDQQLLQKYVTHRDELAYGVLVHRHRDMVWNICWRVLGHQHDTEDAFQATFMTLTRKAASVLWRNSIEGWLHTLAYRLATKAKIERVQRHAREERRARMRKESFDNHPPHGELSELLDRELTCIPEKYRSPLILCYLEGLTREQAAKRMNIPVSRLDRQLAEGRERLRKRIQRRGLNMEDLLLSVTQVLGATPAAIPPRLVERTLDMVRIMTLSNGALETVGISPQVAMLVKGATGMTLKMKLLLGSLLLSLVFVSAGAAKYAGVLNILQGGQQQEVPNQAPAVPKPEKTPPRVDCYGDPLPEGALARLGTMRFRSNKNSAGDIVFTPNSQAIGLLSMGEAPRLWNMKTGEQVRQFKDGLRGQPHVGSWIPLSADGRLMAYKTWHGGRQWKEKKVGFHIREAATGNLIRTFEQTRGEYGDCCAISPDGKKFVAFLNDALRLWDIATGQQIWEQKKIQNHRQMRSLVFSPDGKLVAIGSCLHFQPKTKKGGGIYLYDAHTGKFLLTLGHPWGLETEPDAVSFSPDGQILMALYEEIGDKPGRSVDRCVYLWDVATGKERWHLDKKNHFYHHPAFSPDNKMVALFDQSINPEIGLYEVATGKRIGSCRIPEFAVFRTIGNRLTFSPDGKILVSKWDSYIRCWDAATGKILTLPSFGHESSMNTVAFAADGRTLVSGGENGSVHVWDSFTGQRQRTLSEESSLRSNRTLLRGEFVGSAVSADGRIVAGFRIEFPPPDEKLSSMPIGQAGPALLASMRANIFVWDATMERELRKITLDSSLGFGGVDQLALSPDGKFLAGWQSSGNDANIVKLWEVATGKPVVEKIEGSYPIFSSDSKCLMTHKDGVFSLWEAATGKKVSAVTGVEFENWPKLTVTPDWQTLICAISSTFVGKSGRPEVKRRLYLNSLNLDRQSKLTFGRPRYLDGIGGGNRLVVSPNGKMLAWSHNDGIIHLVETVTGKERARFEGHNEAIRSLCFSPDSRRLASGGNDTTILVWDVSGGWLDDHGQLRSVRVSDPQTQKLWDALVGTDAAKAGRAIWTLAAAPKQTVSFLAKHLSPVVLKNQPSAQRIAQLVVQLDAEKYSVRQKAVAELSKLGEAAEAGIRQALEKKQSLEVSRRLKQLLGAIEDRRQGPSKEDIRYIRAIEVLERIATPEACRLLETLSQGAPGVRQTEEARAALRRLQQMTRR